MNANKRDEKEIVVSQEMLLAGLDVLLEFRGDGDVQLVTEIARAVLRQLREASEQRYTSRQQGSESC